MRPHNINVFIGLLKCPYDTTFGFSQSKSCKRSKA